MKSTLVIGLLITLACLMCRSGAYATDDGPVAWWKFNEDDGNVAVDSVSGNEDEINRIFWYRNGVSGKALKCDGFTTHIVRKAKNAPKLKGAFSVEAWIAPQAYPYNWCAIVNQEKDHKKGYLLGIDHWGRVGLLVAVKGKWVECRTDDSVPFMTEWSHIVGTYDPKKGPKVYVNGELVPQKIFVDGKESSKRIKGKPVFADNMDLQIARNHNKTRMAEETLVRTEVNSPVSYSFDGLIDDIKIYNRALQADEIVKAANAVSPGAPDLKWRKLPEIPRGDGTFGASYSKLKFYPEWDNLWRVTDHPDIVVNFDGNPYSMVFWRGTNFNMNLVTENGKWVGDQSAEGGEGGTIGCCEHMSDKHCRYTYVRLIENNKARVVVHWRYAVNDVYYKIAEMTDGRWGAWADEYYYIYPDGVAIRAFTVYNMNGEHSITEPASYNNPGERAEDNLNVDALFTMNMNGEIRVHSWDPWPSSGEVAAPFTNDLPDANINVVNFKSTSKPYYIYEPGTEVIPYGGGLIELKDYSKFPTWNHWPVGQVPSDGRYAYHADRVSSSAVTSPEPTIDGVDENGTSHGRFVMGLTDRPIEELAPIARAWLQPPNLKVAGKGFKSEGYSRDQRAFILNNETGKSTALKFAIEATKESPIVNPAFVVKNWGDSDIKITINGKKPENGRVGHYRRLEGTDLIIWVEMKSFKLINVAITPKD